MTASDYFGELYIQMHGCERREESYFQFCFIHVSCVCPLGRVCATFTALVWWVDIYSRTAPAMGEYVRLLDTLAAGGTATELLFIELAVVPRQLKPLRYVVFPFFTVFIGKMKHYLPC